MGCDIHSFVAVKQPNQPKYTIVTVRQFSDEVERNDSISLYFTLMQPYMWRSYDVFGFLTNGDVRGESCPLFKFECTRGRFEREMISNLDDNQDTFENQLKTNQVALDYYNDVEYHSHHYTTLANLKSAHKKLKKILKKEKFEDSQTRIYYSDLCHILKDIIENVKVFANSITYHYQDDQVIFCYCFDN